MLSTCVEDPELLFPTRCSQKCSSSGATQSPPWNGPEPFDYSHVDAVVLRVN